jgi:hypothetical protein
MNDRPNSQEIMVTGVRDNSILYSKYADSIKWNSVNEPKPGQTDVDKTTERSSGNGNPAGSSKKNIPCDPNAQGSPSADWPTPKGPKYGYKINGLKDIGYQAATAEREILERAHKISDQDSETRIGVLHGELAATRNTSTANERPIGLRLENLDNNISYVLHSVQELAMATHQNAVPLESYLSGMQRDKDNAVYSLHQENSRRIALEAKLESERQIGNEHQVQIRSQIDCIHHMTQLLEVAVNDPRTGKDVCLSDMRVLFEQNERAKRQLEHTDGILRQKTAVEVQLQGEVRSLKHHLESYTRHCSPNSAPVPIPTPRGNGAVGEKRYFCNACTRNYNRKGNLDQHKKDRHPEQSQPPVTRAAGRSAAPFQETTPVPGNADSDLSLLQAKQNAEPKRGARESHNREEGKRLKTMA